MELANVKDEQVSKKERELPRQSSETQKQQLEKAQARYEELGFVPLSQLEGPGFTDDL